MLLLSALSAVLNLLKCCFEMIFGAIVNTAGRLKHDATVFISGLVFIRHFIWVTSWVGIGRILRLVALRDRVAWLCTITGLSLMYTD